MLLGHVLQKSNITPSEWGYALSQLGNTKSGCFLNKNASQVLKHDFIKVGETIYGILEPVLGRGGYGKVSWVTNQTGACYVCKFTFPENDYKDMPFPESLFKRLGFIKGVTALNEYEQETLAALGHAIDKTIIEGAHITVMRPLGVSLNEYLKTHQTANPYRLALNIVRALYDFHTGLKDNKPRLHNDVKPGNLLIAPQTAKASLIDFSESFEIKGYDPFEIHRHPRPTSFEPFIASPETRNQTGPWYRPFKHFKHVNRLLTIQSDVYLLGSVLKPLCKHNKILKHLNTLILHPDKTKRPTEPILLIVFMILSGCFDKAFEALKKDYRVGFDTPPGFEAFMTIDEEKACAIASCLLISNQRQNYYEHKTLLNMLENKDLISSLANYYRLLIKNSARKTRKIALRRLHGDMATKVMLAES